MQVAKDIELFRQEFFLEKASHVPLNNAGICLLPKVSLKKVHELSEFRAREGAYSVPDIFQKWADGRKQLASFLGSKAEETSWVPNCSAGLSFVANGYKATPNEEIVIFENDYPANFYPWVARAKKHGSQLRIVKAEQDLSRPLEKVIEQITPKTRIVALSHIQSDCGYLMDISEVAQAAHKVGAILVVDVIQSAGVIPLNFQNSGADVFCGGMHKWMCGLMGSGFLVAKDSVLTQTSPSLHGALNYGSYEDEPKVEREAFLDSRRFEQGTPSIFSILGSIESLNVLSEYSVDKIWKKSQELRSLLKEELGGCGLKIYGGATTGPHFSFTHERVSLEKISQALHQEKISHALRPSPLKEKKVLRLSPYAYNTADEIRFTANTIKKAIG